MILNIRTILIHEEDAMKSFLLVICCVVVLSGCSIKAIPTDDSLAENMTSEFTTKKAIRTELGRLLYLTYSYGEEYNYHLTEKHITTYTQDETMLMRWSDLDYWDIYNSAIVRASVLGRTLYLFATGPAEEGEQIKEPRRFICVFKEKAPAQMTRALLLRYAQLIDPDYKDKPHSARAIFCKENYDCPHDESCWFGVCT